MSLSLDDALISFGLYSRTTLHVAYKLSNVATELRNKWLFENMSNSNKTNTNA